MTMYQRKVKLSLTRAQAALVEEVMLKAAAHPDNLSSLNIEPTKTTLTRARRILDITTRAISRRDTAMRKKKNLADHGDTLPSVEQFYKDLTDVDVPLEGL